MLLITSVRSAAAIYDKTFSSLALLPVLTKVMSSHFMTVLWHKSQLWVRPSQKCGHLGAGIAKCLFVFVLLQLPIDPLLMDSCVAIVSLALFCPGLHVNLCLREVLRSNHLQWFMDRCTQIANSTHDSNEWSKHSTYY